MPAVITVSMICLVSMQQVSLAVILTGITAGITTVIHAAIPVSAAAALGTREE